MVQAKGKQEPDFCAVLGEVEIIVFEGISCSDSGCDVLSLFSKHLLILQNAYLPANFILLCPAYP